MRAVALSLVLTSLIGPCCADLAAMLLPQYADFWLVRLLMNLLGYASVFVPGYFLISYYQKIKYNEQKKG